MKKSLSFWQFIGFVFTSVAGTLLHFAYEWSGENAVVGLFSGVNESVWEHMKLLFVPMFIFALVESRYIGKEYENFWQVKLMGMLRGLVLIPVLYYTYTGVLGVSADWFNIAIFYIAAAAAYRRESKLLKSGKTYVFSPAVAIGLLVWIAIMFAVFTFSPPDIGLFQEPRN